MLLIILLLTIRNVTPSNELEFLLENSKVKIGTNIRTEPVAIQFELDGTEEGISTAFVRLKLAQESYFNLPIFATENDFTNELKMALNESMEKTLETQNLLHILYSYLDPKSTSPIEHKCIYNMSILGSQKFW